MTNFLRNVSVNLAHLNHNKETALVVLQKWHISIGNVNVFSIILKAALEFVQDACYQPMGQSVIKIIFEHFCPMICYNFVVY